MTIPIKSSASLVFRAGRGVSAWSERNRQSPVPGKWPYGLERLTESGLAVAPQEVPELSGFARRKAVLLGVKRKVPRELTPEVALCWDELTAAPMLAGASASRYYCGVIWATDAIADGARTPELRLAAKVLTKLDGLWVLSRPQIERVRSWLGNDCPPVHFLRFGIDTDFYAFQPYPEEQHVVSVGGDRDRDAETLFSALEVVKSHRPDVRCTVQSSSDLEPPAGVTKVARLTHVEVRDLLASATVVAVATKPNLHASGITVGLEAQSVGRPVVACSTPGMDDYFRHNDDSLLVPPSTPEAMAESILKLIDDPIAAALMGESGRKMVLNQHSVTTMCADLASIVLR